MNKREIIKLAKQISKTNTAVWDAIGMIEHLLNNEIIRNIESNVDEGNHPEIYMNLAKTFKSIEKNDEELIFPETYSSCFQRYDYFVRDLQIFIDKSTC